MLFIYSSLLLGGIETFFLRLMKQRRKLGKKTRILLLKNKAQSNPLLLAEMRLYAEVFFLEDLSLMPSWLYRLVPIHFILIQPLKLSKIRALLHDIEEIHISSGYFGFFAIKLMKMLGKSIPLSIGLYHSKEFVWPIKKMPFYEKMNRNLFFSVLPRKNIVFFNEKLVDYYEAETNLEFSGVHVFPIGVVDDKQEIHETNEESKKLILGSVGRLVNFKSYNLWLIDVVSELRFNGIDVTCKIYGDGPLRDEMLQKIRSLGMDAYISLDGEIEYKDFSSCVRQFDLFIGSGTAIVEAAWLGVPSIIGIESLPQPMTYGFFSDISGFTYNEDNLFPKVSVVARIKDYLDLNAQDVHFLRVKHQEKAAQFSIAQCEVNFSKIDAEIIAVDLINKLSNPLFRLRYSLSFFIFELVLVLKGKTLENTIYGD